MRRALVISSITTIVVVAGIGLYLGIGCANLTSEANWDFTVFAYENTGNQDGQFVFHGVVYIDGSTGAPRIQNAQLVFRGESGTRMKSVSVGDFGVDAQRRRNVTVKLPRRPGRVELQGQVEAEPDTDWSVIGLEWDSETYEQITLRRDPQPWYC